MLKFKCTIPEIINGTHSKEIKQIWKGTKDFDICLSVIFSSYDQILISGREFHQTRQFLYKSALSYHSRDLQIF